jgi:aspartate 1-decarboxylase
MLTRLLKSKIHRCTVTETNAMYHGSITIDTDLLRACGLLPNELVLVADCDNGNRFETYVIPGAPRSGVIGINGAAAMLTKPGNRLIVMSFVECERKEVAKHHAKVILVDDRNRLTEVIDHPSTLPRATKATSRKRKSK